MCLGDVETAVFLEAPGIETDGQVIGEEIVTGEVEVNKAREPVVQEEDVVGKKIGMNDARLSSRIDLPPWFSLALRASHHELRLDSLVSVKLHPHLSAHCGFHCGETWRLVHSFPLNNRTA